MFEDTVLEEAVDTVVNEDIKTKEVSHIGYGLIRYGLPIAGAVIQRIWNGYSPTTTTTTKNEETSGVGVTSQYDKKTTYAKSTMPRWKRRSWKKIIKKTQAVLLKSLGTKTIVRNTGFTIFPAYQQTFCVANLYGACGTDTSIDVGNSDLRDIFSNDLSLNLATAKAQFFSAVLDITLQNSSVDAPASTGNKGVLETDIYEYMIVKQFDAANLSASITIAQGNTSTIGSASALTMTQRGVTPFDLPDLLARGVKIIKKTKYMMSPGQTATYQLRLPQNVEIRNDNIKDLDANFGRPYQTRGVLIVTKIVPQNPSETQAVPSLSVGVTRKYGYKIMEDSIDSDGYL